MNFASKNMTVGKLNAIVKKLGGEMGALRFLRDEVIVVPSGIISDIIVRVDRSVQPAFPEWVSKVMDPELQSTGPKEYHLATQVSVVRTSDLKDGESYYTYFKENGGFRSCLGFSDALAIQKLGASVFQKVFGKKRVYFLKTVALHRDNGDINIPVLHVQDGEVVLSWVWIGDDFTVACYVAVFEEQIKLL